MIVAAIDLGTGDLGMIVAAIDLATGALVAGKDGALAATDDGALVVAADGALASAHDGGLVLIRVSMAGAFGSVFLVVLEAVWTLLCVDDPASSL